MDKTQIDIVARRYSKRSLLIIVALTVVALGVYALTGGTPSLLVSIAVSLVFSLIAMVAYAASWKSVARSSTPQGTGLAKFYLAAPVLRIVAAVAVVAVYYLAVRRQNDYRTLVLTFTAVFFAFYLVLMIFDCVYFAQVEKHNKTIVK